MNVNIVVIGEFAYGNGTFLSAYTKFHNAKGEPIFLVRVNRQKCEWPEGKPQSFQTARNPEALKKGCVDFLHNTLGKKTVEGRTFEITIVTGEA